MLKHKNDWWSSRRRRGRALRALISNAYAQAATAVFEQMIKTFATTFCNATIKLLRLIQLNDNRWASKCGSIK
jgi:hypothetical protein